MITLLTYQPISKSVFEANFGLQKIWNTVDR